LNLRQMEIFRAMMESGTITAAARLLNVSQPAVSRMLKTIEDQLGLQLFTRERGRLIAMPEAHRLYAEVARVFGNVETVRQTARALRRGGAGVVTIGAMPTLGLAFLPRALKTFHEQHPDVRLHIKTQTVGQIVDGVLRHEFNLGIVYAPVVVGAVMAETLCEAEIVGVLPKGHRLAARPFVTPSDLACEPLISISTSSLFGRPINDAFSSAGIERDLSIQVSYSMLGYALVQAGLGVALMDPLTQPLANIETLEIRPFRPAIPINPKLIFPAHRPLLEVERKLIGHITEAALVWQKLTEHLWKGSR
jgi:DNA-binding transcriptional LysR family regulator